MGPSLGSSSLYTIPMGRVGHIYTLCCPETGEVRYVGKTARGLKVRFNEHISQARRYRKTYCANWILSLEARGLAPTIRLESTWPAEELSKAEVSTIAAYRQAGARLTNLTDGGEGFVGHKKTAEHRRKIGEAHKGRAVSSETRAKISVARTGTKASEETLAKFREVRKGEGNGRASFSERDVLAMRILHEYGVSPLKISKMFGAPHTTTHQALSGASWSHLPLRPNPLLQGRELVDFQLSEHRRTSQRGTSFPSTTRESVARLIVETMDDWTIKDVGRELGLSTSTVSDLRKWGRACLG